MSNRPKITVFADDCNTFTGYVRDRARRSGIRRAAFVESVGNVYPLLGMGYVGRVLLDLVFEGEGETGLDCLKYIKEHHPEIETFVISGKVVDETVRENIRGLGASLINKNDLSWDLLERLLKGDKLRAEEKAKKEDVDVGWLTLQNEELEEENGDIRDLIKLLAEDIVSEIQNELPVVGEGDQKVLSIGPRRMSVKDLQIEVAKGTTIGRRLVRLHRELKKGELR